MQYTTRVLSGGEENFKPSGRKGRNPAEQLYGEDWFTDLSTYKEFFTLIKNSDFVNNKDLDPRLCKMAITLSLLGIELADVALILQINMQDAFKLISFCKVYLKQRWINVCALQH